MNQYDDEIDALIPAPFGFVAVRYGVEGVSVQFLQQALPVKSKPDPRACPIAEQVANYLQDPHTPLASIPSHVGTPFQQRVWQAMREIPVGETRSYGQLASKVQSGPRAVANACGANPVPLFNPCHRVVASQGLGGFMRSIDGGLEIKRWLLAHEQRKPLRT